MEGVLSPSAARRVGYVVSLFPSYDETFILREIAALAERGVELRIFSLRQRAQAVTQEQARPFVARTRYAAYLFSGEVLAALLRAVVRQPAALASFLWLLLSGCWRRPVALAKSLAFVPKAVLFAELARAEGIECLHAHWATYPASAALLMSRLTGIKWGLTCHAHDIFFDPSLLPEKIEAAQFVLTCTADNKRHLETLTRAAAKVQIVYHGLDLSRFSPRPPAPHPGPPRVLAVGSLLKCKGFDILIAATGLLRRRGVELAVTIAGGGPEEAKLRAAAAAEGVGDCVRLTGYLTQQELLPLYQEADLFVLPAVLEQHWGIPNVLVESLACGVPVITTALPSLPELVHDGVHGLVARNRDPGDVADKMETLLRDPALRRRLGEAGRRRVHERFDIRRNIEDVARALGLDA